MTISFAEPVPYYRGSLIELRLLVSDTTRVAVGVTGSDGDQHSIVAPSRPDMLRGPHMMVVAMPYGVRATAVTITRSRPSAGVCVTGLSVVSPVGAR
jgi:hypothetical protein